MDISIITTDSQEQADDLAEQQPAEGPTASFADAVTIALSDEEQRDICKESNIGPYRIIRRIGHGGMGAVYLTSSTRNRAATSGEATVTMLTLWRRRETSTRRS